MISRVPSAAGPARAWAQESATGSAQHSPQRHSATCPAADARPATATTTTPTDNTATPTATTTPTATVATGSDLLSQAGVPPLPEPPWMGWAGEIPTALAQRLACDCRVWRAVLDPATGLPLEVGRTHRIVPHWIRKALHARDRGCRWPGCAAPTAWTDAHHLIEWYYGGETNVDNLLLMCRWHHARVHEGQWRIHLNPATGEVTVTRPDGTPYQLAASQPFTAASHQRAASTIRTAA